MSDLSDPPRPVKLRSVVAFAAGAFVVWCALLALWLGPLEVLGAFFSVGTLAIDKLGHLGNSFGAITALFTGVTVVLVYMTYSVQQTQLVRLNRYSILEHTRQRASFLVDRMERQLASIAGGALGGDDGLLWANKEFDKRVGYLVAQRVEPSERWPQLLEWPGLPDLSPLWSVAHTVRCLAALAEQSPDDAERELILDLVRSQVRSEFLLPLMVACGRFFRGNKAALAQLQKLFADLRIRPVITAAFDLSQVPGGPEVTIDDTLIAQ